jgi:hypothetical protein
MKDRRCLVFAHRKSIEGRIHKQSVPKCLGKVQAVTTTLQENQQSIKDEFRKYVSSLALEQEDFSVCELNASASRARLSSLGRVIQAGAMRVRFLAHVSTAASEIRERDEQSVLGN